MSRTQFFKDIITKYPHPLKVTNQNPPRPHKVDVPFDYGYVPLPGIGKFFLFLTEDDRKAFAKKYALRPRPVQDWPPEKYR